MMMPGRNENEDGYRYGFNGMEKDDEVAGNDKSYDFGARLYNPRVGRWFSTDPHEKSYPNFSTYSAFANNPIIYIDPDGKDIIITEAFKDNATLFNAYKALTLSPTARNYLVMFVDKENGEQVSKNYSWFQQNGSSNYSGTTEAKGPTSLDATLGSLGNTDIIFDAVESNNYGETYFYITDSEGNRINMDDAAAFDKIDASTISEDTKIEIVMNMNLNMTDNQGNTVQTVVHEFGVHATDIVDLIQKLRDGTIDGEEFKKEWKRLNEPGEDMNPDEQHTEFGAGKSEDFEKIYDEIMRSDIPGVNNLDEIKEDFKYWKEDDVKWHKNNYP